MKCWCCGHKLTGRERNYKHHCKLFVLFEIGYDNWEPEAECPKMSKDDFRKNVIKLSGYTRSYFDFNGVLQVEAASISYSNMGKLKFEKCYDDCRNYIADNLLKCGRDDLHDMVMMEF